PPRKRRSPGLAFGISLLLPGLGQIYCGKRRGYWTLFWFLGALCIFIFTRNATSEFAALFWGIGLRAGLALYAFGFIDAYFTARELNRGVSDIVDNANPRVAAVLNLVTNGFGYFYLGERALGIGVFFVMRIINSGAMNANGGPREAVLIMAEVISAGIATHAWVKATAQTKQALAEVTGQVEPQERELGPALPLALAAIMAVNYAIFIAAIVMMPKYKDIDQASAKVSSQGESGSIYENPKYSVRMSVPKDWVFSPKVPDNTVVVAERDGGACNVEILATNVLDSSLKRDALLKALQQHNPDTKLGGESLTYLGGLKASEYAFHIPVHRETISFEMQQRWTIARRGLSVFALVSTFPSMDQDCLQEFEQIRNGVKLQ
ncbi:MAG TPA: hypothetical protein VF135_13030, partial [Terriglobales bacterium]